MRRHGDRAVELVEERVQAAIVVRVPVADHDVLDPARVDTERAQVVHEDGAGEPDVEQGGRRVVAAPRGDQEADPVLGLWRCPPLVEVVDQAGADAMPAVAELQVGQEHVDPVLDQDGDLHAVGLDGAHQKIANGLTGDPTAPVMGSGGAVKKNS